MRTLSFWEAKRTATDKKLRELHKRAKEIQPPLGPAPLRRRCGGKLERYSLWLLRHTRWKKGNATRRKFYREIDKLRRLVLYCDERIAVLKKRNAWHTIARGVL